MRLFAAVVPSAEVLDDIERLVAPLRKDSRLRWAPQEMWHVTTAFFGDADDDELRSLLDGLEHAAAISPVGLLRLANATEFGGKTLVLEVAGDVEGLASLAQRCANAGRSAGLEMERRRYRAHLTIGRSARPRDLSAHVAGLLGQRTRDWDPEELVLFDSRRGDDAHYLRVAAWQLASLSPRPAR